MSESSSGDHRLTSKNLCPFLSSSNPVKKKMNNSYPKREVISSYYRNKVVTFSKEKYRTPN